MDSFNILTGPILYQDMRRMLLVVDDEDINREILGAILEEHYQVLYATNGVEALSLIREHYRSLSAVLLDLIMPEMDGLTVIKEMRKTEQYKQIPVLVLTSERSAEVDSLNLGASDFIPKPYDAPAVILARVNRTIELSEDRSVIQAMERDKLTGLLSKEFFFEYASVTEHFYDDKDMDAVMINVDHFHMVNEIYGRAMGDEVLKTIASTIYQFVRKNEGTAARGEADSFFLYVKRQENYQPLIEQMNTNIRTLSDSLNLHIRMGIYLRQPSDTDISMMFDRAKLACSSIHGKFRESIAVYDSKIQEKALFSERLIHDIHDGLKEKQFKVYYQPKYAIQGDMPRLCSAEALVRWDHPEFGMVSPGAFIPLFEMNGLIQQVDHYVWDEAAAQLRRWKDTYMRTVPVSVNMSRIDVYDSSLVKRLQNLLKEHHLQPWDFHLEITESAYSDNPEQLISVIEQLREKGFIIEMDDFGAGYSSLNMLSSMPIDVLKMDMKFVQSIHRDEKSQKMVELVIQIAKLLNVPVIAEGVEDEKQYEFLKNIGCDQIQGYYFSRPIPAEEFEKKLKEFNQ